VTAGSAPDIRTVTFGEQEPGVWGAVWSLRGASFAVLGSGPDVAVAAGELAGSVPDSDWTLEADGRLQGGAYTEAGRTMRDAVEDATDV